MYNEFIKLVGHSLGNWKTPTYKVIVFIVVFIVVFIISASDDGLDAKEVCKHARNANRNANLIINRIYLGAPFQFASESGHMFELVG